MRLAQRVFLATLVIAFTTLVVSGGQAADSHVLDEKNWYLQAIEAPADIVPHRRSKPIVIAVVDDGMRLTHQDLNKFIWTNEGETPGNRVDDDGNGFVDDIHGWDVSDQDAIVAPPDDRDDFSHGTHLAGIVTRMARTAYGDSAAEFIRIMPVKTLADDSPTTYLKEGYEGIEYAIKAGAEIIIAAWGVAYISPDESLILQHAADQGILIVASGGNFPEEREQFPAAHPAVIAVGSIERDGQKTVKSNYGQFLDLSAPGTGISSAAIFSDDGYETLDGSSFSTAMVATAAAFIKLKHPAFSPKEIESCLKSASTPIETNNFNFDAKLGAGRLNVEAAIACDILTGEMKVENRLTHSKGFLRAKGKKIDSVAWAIEPPGRFAGIRFTPVFNREEKTRGTLEFRADDSPDSEVIASHPLDALPESIYVAGTTAHVTFVNEKKRKRFDWMLEYEAETIDFSKLYCRGTREIEVEGELSDGSGEVPYSANSDCKWLITAPVGQVINFQFAELHTESKTDMIYFFNGAGTHEQIMAIFSGGELPPELTTWSNQVLVWFVTDGKNEGQGWRANYQFRDP